VLKSIVVGGLAALAFVLVPTGMAAPPGQHNAGSIHRYVVHGVYTREQRSQLVASGYDIGEAFWADHVELYGTRAQARALSLAGLRLTPKSTDEFPPGDEGYHTYAEMVTDLQQLAAAHPSTVHPISLGQSYEGRDLIGVRIADDATDNLSEPGVLFVGQHHAREHLTPEVVLSLAHQFAESSKVTIGNLVHTRQIYIFPSLNPDGAEYDIAGGSYHFWRKNRQPYQGIYGTDNNRNYSYNWGCCGGSSGDPNSEVFRGPSAFSTPEDQHLRDFVIAHPNVMTAISYHTYSALVLYPYGYTYEDEPPDMTHTDHLTFMAMGAEMSRTTGYPAVQSSDLYITDGDFDDWMYGEMHRYPVTIEMSGGTFYPPDEFIAGEARRNWDAAFYAARIADCPTKIVGVDCS
jgi:carboxypeptidase T